MSQNKQSESLYQIAMGRPELFSIIIIAVSGLLTEIPFNIFFEPWLKEPAPELWKVFIGHTLTGLILVWLVVKLGIFKGARFTGPRKWKAVWLVWPFAIFTLLNLDSLFDGSLVIDTSRTGLIILFVFVNLAIGFTEEVMGRGLVLNVLLQKWGGSRRGIVTSVIVSSLLFGFAHILNLLTGRLHLLANLTQIGYSIAFGVAFAACFLRNNSIWPVIIMHAAVDLAGGLRHISVGGGEQIPMANDTVAAAITSLIISVPLLLYGLFILRKVEPVE